MIVWARRTIAVLAATLGDPHCDLRKQVEQAVHRNSDECDDESLPRVDDQLAALRWVSRAFEVVSVPTNRYAV